MPVPIGSNRDDVSASKSEQCVYGPGAKIFGDIIIADNIAIGTNSVVNKSVYEKNISIAGILAKK
jgi:serine O-acetyltransferase